MSESRELPRDLITSWLAAIGWEHRELSELPGDVSLRRYARVVRDDGRPAVVSYCPPAIADNCSRFVRSTALLRAAGVDVPEILAADCDRGLTLLEDVGSRSLYDLATEPWSSLRPLLRRATAQIQSIASLDRSTVAALNPALDATRLRSELRKSWELFLEPRGLIGRDGTPAALASAFHTLCEELAAGELVPCHRDFMARNLMVPGDGRLVVIDHQDLRLGPPVYDLASLLNDSLFPDDDAEAEVLGWLELDEAGLLAYRRAVVQRCIKAIGTFCAFAARGFPKHLRLVAPCLRRAWRQLPGIPELRGLVATLRPTWAPVPEGRLLD